MASNLELVEYAKKALNGNSCYIYGTFGQKVTEQLIDEKAKQYPTQMTAKRVKIAKEKHLGKTAWDCSGLIKGFIMGGKYNADQDKNARGMYNSCTKKGDIISIPEIPGILVFNKSLTHVGIYIGAGEVIEAKGFDYGIRKTLLKDFTYWGQYCELEYKSQEVAPKCYGRVIALGGLNIRKAPGINSEKVGAYNFWDKFEILGSKDGWYKTDRGYVCGDYVRYGTGIV